MRDWVLGRRYHRGQGLEKFIGCRRLGIVGCIKPLTIGPELILHTKSAKMEKAITLPRSGLFLERAIIVHEPP